MTTRKKSPELRLLKLFTPRPVNRDNSDDTLFVVPIYIIYTHGLEKHNTCIIDSSSQNTGVKEA